MTADKERFMPWRTIEGEDLAPESMAQLDVLIRLFEHRRLLDYVSNFVVFEEEQDRVIKRWPGTISIMPSTRRWRPRLWHPGQTETVVAVWSGILRDRARA